jgi:mannan endo-1,4-beta-mannosidase
MIKDIDYISGQLKRFQDNHIPIIWRPLHEAAGGWFWWGTNGPACKKLWQVMYDRMVNVNGLHNLIWVWTREPNDDTFYPGDEYVDIVGRDIYRTGDHSSQVLEFNDMNVRYGGKKLITISECGSMPDVDNLIKDGAGWSWFMVWNGDFVRKSVNNPLDLWKKMFANGYVYTLDEMPNLKTYTTPEVKTGLNITNDNLGLQVYPTYFENQITIRSGEPLEQISIYNQLGICINKVTTENKTMVISMAGFPSGIYLVKAGKSSAVKVFKR